MVGTHPTEDDLLMDLIKTNRRTDGETMTRKQYRKHGKYNPWQAVNRFGSWREARAAAGVFRSNPDRKQVENKEILEDMAKVHEKTDGHLQVKDYREHGKYSVSLIYTRFPSFKSARAKAYKI